MESAQSLNTVERLLLFRDRVGELNQLRLVRSQAKMKYQFKWDAESAKMTSQAQEPDEEDLRSFLLLFRQFISKKEPIFINRIFNDCIRFLVDKNLKTEVIKAKEAWKEAVTTGMGEIRVNKSNLTPEHVLDLWINGYYFHNDAQKATELKRLLAQPLPLARMRFLLSLADLFRIVSYMGAVVSHGLESDLFEIPGESSQTDN